MHPPHEPPLAPPSANSKRHGIVRVREYHCRARSGDPPQSEQFDHASIAVVRAGTFGIRTEKRTELLSRGFLLLGNAEQPYEASHEHGVGDFCLVFDFGERVVEELADAARRRTQRRPFAVNVLPPQPRADAWCKLAEEELAEGATPMALEEVGLALAAYAIEIAGTGSARPRAAAPNERRCRDRVVAAIEQIERAASSELSLADLAANAGLTPFYFLRLFKRETGVTPHRFLVQTRIRRAIELLRDTRQPITEIAFAVGFGDLSNFINAFRREIGRSPREYRRSGMSRGRAG